MQGSRGFGVSNCEGKRVRDWGDMPVYAFRAQPKAAFMCECGAGLCEERIWMTGTDYEAGVEPVLASAHAPRGGGLGKCPVCGRPGRGKRRKRR